MLDGQACNFPLCRPACLNMYSGNGTDEVHNVTCCLVFVSCSVLSASENRTKVKTNELTLKSQPWMLKGHQCSALTQCVVTWSSIMSRAISTWPQFKVQVIRNLGQASKWSWNNNTFVKEWKRPIIPSLIAMLVERILASEIFFVMHWAHHWILAWGFSVFHFHPFSFSRILILYYRRREFGGCKSPFSRLSCFYSRT